MLIKSKGNLILTPGAKVSAEITPNHKQADFENAYSSANERASFVEVPVTYDRKIGFRIRSTEKKDTVSKEILKASFERLIISKDKGTGVIDEQVIFYVPTLEYLKKHNNDISHNHSNKIDPDYDGYLGYRKWDGTLLYLLIIENGKVIKKIQKGAAPKKGYAVSYEQCTTDYVEYYEMICNYECYWSFLYADWVTTCTDNGYPGVSYNSSTGMLEFSDSTAYRTILDSLTSLYQAHQANFFDPLDAYTDDQVETMINNTGFDEFAPLRAFENYFGFSSLRQKVETEELTWLNQSNPFTSNNPDDLYYIDDEVERTLFNESSQVKIGNLLIDYSSFPMLEETNETCVGNGWATDPPYNVSEFSIFEESVGSDWRVWEKIVVRQGTTYGSGRSYFVTPAYLKAKIKSYKAKSNGHWKKKATKLDAKINGYMYRPIPWNNIVPSTWTQYSVVQSYEGLHRRFHQERSKRVNDRVGVKYCDLHADFLIDGGALTSSIDLVPNHRNP